MLSSKIIRAAKRHKTVVRPVCAVCGVRRTSRDRCYRCATEKQ